MKKIVLCFCAALLAVMLLAGCSASSFDVVSSGAGGIAITAKNADTSSSAVVDFTVSEDGTVVFDASSLTKGQLKMTLKDGSGKNLSESTVSAAGQSMFDVVSGEYSVEVSVLETADGEAKITVQTKS